MADPKIPAPSAVLIRLAKKLGYDARALAASIPQDTLRRTRYPAIEQEQEDGASKFKHPHYSSQVTRGGSS